MWEAAKELNVNHSTVFQLLKQTGEVKKLSKWVPHEWTENQKDCCFEASSSLILCNTNKLFLDDWIVMCSKKSILYNWWWPAWWLDREEALPKATIAPKKVMVTVWWSAAGLIHNRFLNPGKNHYIWEVCSANQWDSLKTARPAANIGEQNGFNSPWQPTTSRCTTNASKVEILDLGSFASFIIFTWPLASWLPLLQASRQLFAGKMLPQPAGGRKCFPRVPQFLKHGFLCYRNKQTFLIGKIMLIVMVPISMNKDVPEPSYDLKFTVQNWSNIFTNLIVLYTIVSLP